VKRKAPKNTIDMAEVMAREPYLFYITFLGDAIVIKGNITFNKAQAEKHYVFLLNHAVNLFNDAKTLKEKTEASQAFLSLQILPLRIH
jgi:hypothetical protein